MADNKQTLKLPPQSLEAEQAVLGCMLIDPDAVSRTLHLLTEKSFFNSAHAHVYTAISNLFEKNETVDNITVTDELKKIGINCFGPESMGAQLEGSKDFAKAFMKRHNIPTANYESFTSVDEAMKYWSLTLKLSQDLVQNISLLSKITGFTGKLI